VRALKLQPKQEERHLAAKKKATKKKAAKRKAAAKRELIATGTNMLFVRRNERGTSFKEVVDVGWRLIGDRSPKGSPSLAKATKATAGADRAPPSDA
jgi:hypothetical protein